MGCCCDRGIKSKGGAGNGAASLYSGSLSNPAKYTGAAGVCSGGPVVGSAPFLTSPEDFNSLSPVASVPIVQRLGRRAPNNVYVFTPPPAGVTQVQSPKVGRY
jgi:hypothetical protein